MKRGERCYVGRHGKAAHRIAWVGHQNLRTVCGLSYARRECELTDSEVSCVSCASMWAQRQAKATALREGTGR